MDKTYSKGQKLCIYLLNDDQYFEGAFYSINADRTRITLNKITRFPDQKYFENELHFYRNEIKEIEAANVEFGMEALMDPMEGRSLAHNKVPTHAHLYRMSGRNVKSTEVQKGMEVRRNHPHYPKYQKQFENYIVVDKIDDIFHDVVQYMSKVVLLGVALEGEVLGRQGKLCWINISTRSRTVLFDVLALGAQCFDMGLRSVLQSEATTKIMHDCRMAADCLLHQFDVKLTNVIDTQVLDLMLLRQRSDQIPNYVTSLNECLQRYLHIPDKILFFPMLREQCLRTDGSKWCKRPLDEDVEGFAIQNVVFLLDLRLAILSAILHPVYAASDLYISQVSSMPDNEAVSYYGSIHMTPMSVFSVGKKKSDDERSMENVNPNIRFSRDVMHYMDKGNSSNDPPNIDSEKLTSAN